MQLQAAELLEELYQLRGYSHDPHDPMMDFLRNVNRRLMAIEDHGSVRLQSITETSDG